MMQKLNTFHDFIDCAEFLVRNKYTSPDRLVIQGGSAGGLLVGAVVNMRPDLFKAVVAEVPFVDVMNTMLDASVPLTTSEWIEWGNPNKKAEFDYMVKYSPYDNVTAQNYPSMLVRGVAQRQPGPLLGGHEARREAARHQDRHERAPAQGEHGGRARGILGAVRRAAGNRVQLFVHVVADGCDRTRRQARETVDGGR